MNPNSVIHLVGGGPGAVGPMRRHFKNALAELPTVRGQKPLVAYVGAASGDNAGFRRMIAGMMPSARVEPVMLAKKSAKVSAARTLLEDSDLIFVSGGDVHAGMGVLQGRGVDTDLRTMAQAGKPMLGVSAGSLMLAQQWIHFPDDDSDDGVLFDCLGIAPVIVDAHSEDDDWSELQSLLRHRRRWDRTELAMGLPRHGALRIELKGKRSELKALGVPLPRFTKRNGKVLAAAPLHP